MPYTVAEPALEGAHDRPRKNPSRAMDDLDVEDAIAGSAYIACGIKRADPTKDKRAGAD